MKIACVIEFADYPTYSSIDFDKLWIRCGFIEKLKSLSDLLIVVGTPSSTNSLGTTARASDFREAAKIASFAHCGLLVVVDPRQIFLDFEIVESGLRTFIESSSQYFTQWEHCMLPIGIGVRAWKMDILVEAAITASDDWVMWCVNRSKQVDSLYDDNEFCSFNQSLLDSRLAANLVVQDLELDRDTWSLSGFLHWSNSDHKSNSLKYHSEALSRCFDHRGMPAIYGFETTECAVFPTYVMIDVTNTCNARCAHCPHSIGFSDQNTRKFVDIDVYCKVIDECVGQKIDVVRLTGDGEPLLHPRLADMVKYATSRGVGPVALTTNGSALNDVNILRLLDAGLDVIDISIDAASPESFAITRAGLDYEKTVANVLRLLDLRNERGSDLSVMVSFVKQAANESEVEAFSAYWGSKVDRVLIRDMTSNVGINTVSGPGRTGSVERWPCPHWFRRITLNYDNQLKACPIDWENESIVGDLKEKSIGELWNGETYRRNRKEHLNDAISPCSLCHGCGDWRSTPWHMGYEKVIVDM